MWHHWRILIDTKPIQQILNFSKAKYGESSHVRRNSQANRSTKLIQNLPVSELSALLESLECLEHKHNMIWSMMILLHRKVHSTKDLLCKIHKFHHMDLNKKHHHSMFVCKCNTFHLLWNLHHLSSHNILQIQSKHCTHFTKCLLRDLQFLSTHQKYSIHTQNQKIALCTKSQILVNKSSSTTYC